MIIRKLALVAAVGAVAVGGTPGLATAAGGTQDFTVVKLGASTGTVVARGLINGAGTEENTRHNVLPGQAFDVTFTFPAGTLSMHVLPGQPEIDMNPTSCLARITLHPFSKVSVGTGAYTGAQGEGFGTSNITTIANRAADGSCLPPPSPLFFELAVVRTTIDLVLP
jgi:hypothetical protein